METLLEKTPTTLEVKRVFEAPLALLYQAWTHPEMLDQWFHPGEQMHSVCKVDLRVGNRYQVEMHSPRGGPHIVGGVYREIVPQEKLVFTWQWRGEDVHRETTITVLFRALGPSQTEVTLLHEGFEDQEELDSHGSGWLGTFDQLAVHVEA